MNPLTVSTITVIAGLLVLTALSFNRFVRQRNLLRDSWANIDTELRRRHDLVPNLVETVSGYARHERTSLQAVIEARSAASTVSADVGAQARTEQAVTEGLRALMAVAERYPELHASEHFLDLQRELVSTEDRIQAARRIYNANVRAYNTRLESVPTNVVGRLGGFEHAAYFELQTAALPTSSPTTAW